MNSYSAVRLSEETAMQREEKRRKFHEALLSTLYPPPSPPRRRQPQAGAEAGEDDESRTLSLSREEFNVNLVPDDYGVQQTATCSPATEAEDDDDGDGTHKLTRAQRKRLRKKKLREELSRRSEIIGPLLPPSSTSISAGDGGSSFPPFGNDDPQGVRRNVVDTSYAAANASPKPGEAPTTARHKKLKQRRMVKKSAKEKLKTSANVEDCVEEGQSLLPSIEENCDQDQNLMMGSSRVDEYPEKETHRSGDDASGYSM